MNLCHPKLLQVSLHTQCCGTFSSFIRRQPASLNSTPCAIDSKKSSSMSLIFSWETQIQGFKTIVSFQFKVLVGLKRLIIVCLSPELKGNLLQWTQYCFCFYNTRISAHHLIIKQPVSVFMWNILSCICNKTSFS